MPEQQIEHFKLLSTVALSDGILADSERAMLFRCGRWLGIRDQEAEGILQELAQAGGVKLTLPAKEKRQRVFNAMVNVAVADGVLTPKEELCLRNMAGSFGLCPDEVARTIHVALRQTSSVRAWPNGWNKSPHFAVTQSRLEPPKPAESGIPRLMPGSVVAGKFRLKDVIGCGGCGTVFRAFHEDLEEDVALKVLNSDIATSDQARKRFMREVKTTRSFVHRYAVPLREFGRDEHDRLYFTMDLVVGENLRTVLDREGALPFPRVVRLVSQALQALYEAHRVGIVHRDLKPENLVATKGAGGHEEVRVLDFGVSKAVHVAGASQDLTGEGRLVGTLAYMSPEQVRGKKLDPRSDLFTMGVVLYELIAGRPPLDAELEDEEIEDRSLSLLYRIMTEEAPALTRVAPNTPKALSEVVHKSLNKDPDRRYSDARAMAEALAAATRDVPQASPTHRLGNWLRSMRKGDSAPESMA